MLTLPLHTSKRVFRALYDKLLSFVDLHKRSSTHSVLHYDTYYGTLCWPKLCGYVSRRHSSPPGTRDLNPGSWQWPATLSRPRPLPPQWQRVQCLCFEPPRPPGWSGWGYKNSRPWSIWRRGLPTVCRLSRAERNQWMEIRHSLWKIKTE